MKAGFRDLYLLDDLGERRAGVLSAQPSVQILGHTKNLLEVVAVIVRIECDEYGPLVIEDYLRGAEDAAFEL
jgi:hypothetical protein